MGEAPSVESAGHDVARAAVVGPLRAAGCVVGVGGLDDHHYSVDTARCPLDAPGLRDAVPEDLPTPSPEVARVRKGFRVSIRTERPRFRSFPATWCPVLPVPPTTCTGP